MKNVFLFFISTALLLNACGHPQPQVSEDASTREYKNVSVHDPSIMRAADGTFYVIGSHMAGAKSIDLIDWEQLSINVGDQNFFVDIQSELGDVMKWGHTRTFWAGCLIQLKSGKYMMNYCVCQGNCPQAAIGYALADNPEGPYKDMGVLLYSFGTRNTEDIFDPKTLELLGEGQRGNVDIFADVTIEDGTVVRYNSNFMPNAIDPTTFYDADGRLWMLYGSYSGGIFILELNEDGTIKRKEGDDYYGKYIMGGYHTPIEGPYIMYSPETEYYYIFNSYGGLNSTGGYNMRVARSKTPDGDYFDPAGNVMTDCKGIPGQTMLRQNGYIEKYGLKLMGNFVFQPYGEEVNPSEIYMSPGHNSAYYDSKTGKYFLIFHTRFKDSREQHQVRVHEMFMNEDGWPVVAPHRFSGEIAGSKYNKEHLIGTYKMINHGINTSGDVVESQIININDDNTISGAVTGTWNLGSKKDHFVSMTIDNKNYKGIFHYQYDPANNSNRMTFSVCGESNETIWGSKINL